MVRTVYLDLDGVVTNFIGGVCKAFNKPNPYPKLTRDYTFWNAWPKISTKMVNAICTAEFWEHLEWMHDGHDILRTVLDHFKPEQIYLATYPMANVGSATGKWVWVEKNLPEYYGRTIITQAPKSLLARPDTLLIDDKDENVEEFAAAGGRGLLVPRPWNRVHFCADKTLEVVQTFLEDLDA